MESIYQTPDLGPRELACIESIDELRKDLVQRLHEPRRWVGGLRRMSLARNVQASNSIEGYNATLDDVLLTVDGEQPLDADEETTRALTGYREAMTWVLQIAEASDIVVDSGMLRALHFMMLKYDLSKGPGNWRPGAIYVARDTGERVYEGPEVDRVPELMEALVSSVREDTGPALVRAAMAHLNLVMIHPFRDGNGRMARCLQTLVLAREHIVHPVFSSIEEYLGRNTPAYYDVLARVGQSAWHPENDALPWMQYCLRAHLLQARTVVRRIAESERLWMSCLRLAQRHRLNERTVAGLWDAARGLRIRRPGYIALVQQTMGEQISEQIAGRDLKDLVTAGLLVPHGATRGRFYLASEELKDEWRTIRNERGARPEDNPFGG